MSCPDKLTVLFLLTNSFRNAMKSIIFRFGRNNSTFFPFKIYTPGCDQGFLLFLCPIWVYYQNPLQLQRYFHICAEMQTIYQMFHFRGHITIGNVILQIRFIYIESSIQNFILQALKFSKAFFGQSYFHLIATRRNEIQTSITYILP